MEDKVDLIYRGKSYKFPLINGSENEPAIDIKTLRAQTGLITLDPGYKNTGSCESEITFLDGEEGILRYRGYSIDDLANKFQELKRLAIRYKEGKDIEIQKLNTELDKFKKAVEDNNILYETMLDKTTESLEKILSNTESISKIQ